MWRGGRAVEGARLEIVYTGNRIEGSNPSLSAIIFLIWTATKSSSKELVERYLHNVIQKL